MAQRRDDSFGTYRCPVCGHRDVAELRGDERVGAIVCSYCETPLAVSSRGRDSVWLSAQVAEETASR